MDYNDEMNYRISLCIAEEMLEKKMITQWDFNKINSFLIEKYNSKIGGLLSGNDLIN